MQRLRWLHHCLVAGCIALLVGGSGATGRPTVAAAIAPATSIAAGRNVQGVVGLPDGGLVLAANEAAGLVLARYSGAGLLLTEAVVAGPGRGHASRLARDLATGRIWRLAMGEGGRLTVHDADTLGVLRVIDLADVAVAAAAVPDVASGQVVALPGFDSRLAAYGDLALLRRGARLDVALGARFDRRDLVVHLRLEGDAIVTARLAVVSLDRVAATMPRASRPLPAVAFQPDGTLVATLGWRLSGQPDRVVRLVTVDVDDTVGTPRVPRADLAVPASGLESDAAGAIVARAVVGAPPPCGAGGGAVIVLSGDLSRFACLPDSGGASGPGDVAITAGGEALVAYAVNSPAGGGVARLSLAGRWPGSPPAPGPPLAPVPLWPVGGAVAVHPDAAFAWRDPGDGGRAATSFRLRFVQDGQVRVERWQAATGLVALDSPAGDGRVYQTVLTPHEAAALVPGAVVTWEVSAANDYDASWLTGPGVAFSLADGDSHRPLAPRLLQPGSGAIQADRQPALVWLDPAAGTAAAATVFRVRLRVAGAATWLLDSEVPADTLPRRFDPLAAQSVYHYLPEAFGLTHLPAQTPIEWVIGARNDAQPVGWSYSGPLAASFTTGAPAVDPPALVAPPADAVHETGVTAFEWTAPEQGTPVYRLVVRRGAAVILDTEVAGDRLFDRHTGARRLVGTRLTSSEAARLAPATRYDWYVGAADDDGGWTYPDSMSSFTTPHEGGGPSATPAVTGTPTATATATLLAGTPSVTVGPASQTPAASPSPGTPTAGIATATVAVSHTPTVGRTLPPASTATATRTTTATRTATPTRTMTPTRTVTATRTATTTATATATVAPPAALAGATDWYFAEGYTGPGFDEYLTILNPHPRAAVVEIIYYRTGAPPITRQRTVAPTARLTIAVHDQHDGVGRDQAVSARVRSVNGVGVVVERPIYFIYGDGVTGGHTALGVAGPRADWLFAEGYTGPGFDTYLTILNPNDDAAPVTMTYFLDGGQAPVARALLVPAASRVTVAVHDPVEGVGRDQAVSAHVSTSHPGGIVVERPVYFRYEPEGDITGGHTVVGAAGPRPRWYFSDGSTLPGFSTYVTLFNPAPAAAPVRLTYLIDGETTPRQTELLVAATSRATVAVNDAATGVPPGKRFGIIVEALDGSAIVAERPVYFRYTPTWEPLGVTGGHTTLGASAPARAWLFAEGYTGPGFDQELIVLNPQLTAVDVTVTYHLSNGTLARRGFRVPGGRRTVLAVHSATQGIGRGQAVAVTVEATYPGAIVAERAMYFLYHGQVDGGHAAIGYSGVDLAAPR